MMRDLFHAFVNVERGSLVFAWVQLPRTAAIAHEYVEDRRRRYYGQLATLAVLVASGKSGRFDEDRTRLAVHGRQLKVRTRPTVSVQVKAAEHLDPTQT